MKNQYVGDIGDYGKYSLLRFLARRGIRIGVNWYLTNDDGSSDGGLTKYLEKDIERGFDPTVYEEMKRIVDTHGSAKTVRMIPTAGLIPDAVFFDEELGTDKMSPPERTRKRDRWFNASMAALSDSDLIFADPDNGITFTKKAGRKGCEKYILPDEIAKYYYCAGKDVVFYCHKGRRSDDVWKQTIAQIKEHICDARLFVLTYHRGTQRSYIFVTYPEHADRYGTLLSEFVSSTPWGKSKAFTREKPIEDFVNAVPVKDAQDRCGKVIPTGFAAPTIGTLHPEGSTLVKNGDGTVTVVPPAN